MVVVALVAVLAMIAAPSFRELIVAQRVKAINAEIVTDLQFARGEAARRNRTVLVRFRAEDNCYVIYAESGSPGACDCSRPPGSVCTGLDREEIKTVRVPSNSGVSIVATSDTGQIVRFEPISGQSPLDDFQIAVTGNPRGQLHTHVNRSGRPTVCSPDGSIGGVPQC
jgi:type IV fimbrial biogenesis protein FimT